MKKIGLISSHRVVNYGSILQAYALQYMIDKLGNYSQYIDYIPERVTMKSMLKKLKDKNELLRKHIVLRTCARIVIFPSYVKRFYSLRKFLKKYIKLSPKKYRNLSELENEKFDYDVYCTGSDQVWNSEWNGEIDKPYFLSFVDEKHRKISYAASFGREKLFDWEIDETRSLLQRYNAISVREKSGLKILNELEIKNGQCVLDPTLLLSNAEWSKLTNDKFKNEEYILVYNLNRSKKIYDYAKKLSECTGLKVKYITYQLHEFSHYGKMYCNPRVETFLTLFKNATYVVTDSFHGTAFSLNFNRQFIIMYPNKFSTRLESILKLTKLENRVVKDINEMDIYKTNINYDDVNKIIERERKESILFLKENI